MRRTFPYTEVSERRSEVSAGNAGAFRCQIGVGLRQRIGQASFLRSCRSSI